MTEQPSIRFYRALAEVLERDWPGGRRDVVDLFLGVRRVADDWIGPAGGPDSWRVATVELAVDSFGAGAYETVIVVGDQVRRADRAATEAAALVMHRAYVTLARAGRLLESAAP